jgi:formate dehydrogenase alpha subunit
MTEIKSFGPHPLDCEFCGGCVQICPVGAITSRLSMYEYRPWMLKRADTICHYCGDGCQITVQAKGNELVEVNSSYGAGRNNGDLCARGFFGYHAASHPERLTKPLIRRDGALTEATWEEALTFAVEQIARLKQAHGPEAFGGLITGRCTNEELYLFQKFMRLAIGTNNLDSSARHGHLNGIHAMRRVQGTHRWTVTFEDIAHADTLLLVGTQLTETNPITGLKVKEAVKKRQAALFTIEALRPAIGTVSNIVNLAEQHICALPPQFGTVALGLLKGVIEGGHVDPTLAAQAPDFVTAVSGALQGLSWDTVSTAAETTREQCLEIAGKLGRGHRVVILAGQDLLRSEGAYRTCMNLLDLLLLTGKLTAPGCGFAPLAEENNDQGAVEMGAVAEFLPGCREVADQESRVELSRAWKGDLPATAGATLMDMLDRMHRGSIKAMIIVGENPAGSLPAHLGANEALRKLDLLVCQELFLSETASLAHVVLPAASAMEKAGTFTNTEGHVQAVRAAIEPAGESRPDWEILSALAILLGAPLDYEDAKTLLKEIRSILPGHGMLGPAPAPPKADDGAVKRYLAGGYRRDLADRYTPAPRPERAEGTVHLMMGQSLFHSGKLSTRAKGLLQVEAGGSLRLNPADAARLSVTNGDRVRLSNRYGSLTTTVTLVERVPEGSVWFPDHFAQKAAALFGCVIDPETRVPAFRTTSVSIVKTA